MTERSWVQTPTMETIFQAPFIWIKAWNKNCNPSNGRVDFEEWSAYKNPATWYWMNCKLVSQLRPKSNKKKYLKNTSFLPTHFWKEKMILWVRWVKCVKMTAFAVIMIGEKKVKYLFQSKNFEWGNVHRFLQAKVFIYIKSRVQIKNRFFIFCNFRKCFWKEKLG